MSLTQQLNLLQKEKVKKIGPGAIVPSLLLDNQISRNTSIEVLYTMAIIGFTKMKDQLVQCGKSLGQELLSESMKDINRNRLTQTQNRLLSVKITKFLVMLCPYFLNDCCLIVVEYMLRNFQIHIFESEQMSIIFLQYWQNPSYIKLVQNIEVKSQKLNWLKQIQHQKSINIAYIIKTIHYNRNIFDYLLLYTKTLIKEQTHELSGININILSRPTTDKIILQNHTLISSDPKKFTLTVLIRLIQTQNGYYLKDILEFCNYCSKCELQEANDSAIMIALCALSSNLATAQFGSRILKNLLEQGLSENTFNFMMVLWQRYPKIFTESLVKQIVKMEGLLGYISDLKKSKSMIFYTIFELYFLNNFPKEPIILQILQTVSEEIKKDPFVLSNEERFYCQIFALYEEGINGLELKYKQFINNLIKNHFMYEMACYGQRNSKGMKQILSQLSIEEIKKQYREKKQKEKQSMMVEEQPLSEQFQQVESEEEEKGEKETILSMINKRINGSYQKIEYKNSQVKEAILEIVKQYYQNSSTLSSIQKNTLFEHPAIFPHYSPDYFLSDLENEDYTTPIKYLLKEKNLLLSQKVLEYVKVKFSALQNILFRQLARIAINVIVDWGDSSYNKCITYLGILYSEFAKVDNLEGSKLINQLMNKISFQLFSKCGLHQGKFYKMLSFHTRMFVKLFVHISANDEDVVNMFQTIIQIFSPDNTYCVLIGIAEMLPLYDECRKTLIRFIKKIFIPKLLQQEEVNSLAKTMEKMLTFGCHMLLEGGQVREEEQKVINASLSTNIAKKMMVNLFGLKNKKGKRIIVKKLMVFLLQVFQSSKFVDLFKASLRTMTQQEEQELVQSYCSIYSLLFKLSKTIEGPLKSVLQLLKEKNLALFPLQIKIDIFSTLLPQQQAYFLLADELRHHPKRNLTNLAPLINAKVSQLTDGWCSFISECLRRGYFPQHQTCELILNCEVNHNMVEFICKLTESAQKSMKYMEKIMEIIFGVCCQGNEYSLAILHRLISNLGQYLHPYLPSIFTFSIQIQSPHMQSFISNIVSVFTPPTLLQLFKENHKKVANLKNFTLFLLDLVDKVNHESIMKDIKLFFARSLNFYLEEEEDYVELHQLQASIVERMVMKMNEDQLRKLIREYHSWSSQRTNMDAIFNSRRHLLISVFFNLSKRLGQLFSSFYGYIWQGLLEDLQHFAQFFQSTKSHSSKRQRQITNYHLKCSYQYLSKTLSTLIQLFNHDRNNQFMDATKFDALAPILPSLFNITEFKEYYEPFLEHSLLPCLLNFYTSTKDDYRLKHLNNQVLQMLRVKDGRIEVWVYRLLQMGVKELDYRFLLFVDDMVPLLMQSSNSRNVEVKKSVESIIYQIQSISGEKIENYMR